MATTAPNNTAAMTATPSSVNSTDSKTDSKPAGSKANDSLTDAYQHMQGAVNSVKEAASTLTASSSAAAKDAYAQGKVKACDASKQADSWIKERPYTSMGLAFAAGVLITGLLKK